MTQHRKEVPELEGLYDPGRVALHGSGAGGYLASLTALHLAEVGRNASALIAHAPMVMPFGGTPSMLDFGTISCYSPLPIFSVAKRPFQCSRRPGDTKPTKAT